MVAVTSQQKNVRLRDYTISVRPSDFRDTFAETFGGETLRAVLVFGTLLGVLVFLTVQLTFRDLNLRVWDESLDLGSAEARHIATTVADLGRDGPSVDFSRVRAQQQVITFLIRERLAKSGFIHHVEVVDRFGIRQLFVSGAAVEEPAPESPDLSFPDSWPRGGEQVVSAPIPGSEGTVKLGISAQPLQRELSELRGSLQRKIVLAATLAVGVLFTGLFYVLHLIRKNRALEHSRRSAERASYVGLLASGLAHEIRNPLNAMNMNLQMLEEELRDVSGMSGVTNGECGELLESTKSEIKRLEGLVNNFLAYARPAQPRFAPEDLNAVVSEVARFLEIDFRQHQLELRLDLEPLLPAVDLDATQFKQALMNLLVNARQVLPTGGVVHVRTRAGAGGDVLVEVEDDGPGIPDGLKERIFEVFFSSRGGGTGLGLPIARQIIERHGGTIEVDSAEGRGSTFRMHLPRHHPASAAAPAAATR